MLRLLSSFLTGLPFLLGQTKHRTLCFDVYMLGINLHFPLVHGGAPSCGSKHSSMWLPLEISLGQHKDLQSASFSSLLLPGAAHYPTHCLRHSFRSPGHRCPFFFSLSYISKDCSLPNCIHGVIMKSLLHCFKVIRDKP